MQLSNKILDKINRIKLLIFDVDGVLTDGSIFISSSGEEYKRFSIEDGTGAAFARLAKLPLALISGRFSKATSIRAKELKINDCYQGSLNKLSDYYELCKKYNVNSQEVAYIGDSYIDIPVMKEVGLPITVPNANNMVKNIADYVTIKKGGEGVLLEVVELILFNQGRFDIIIKKMEKNIYKS